MAEIAASFVPAMVLAYLDNRKNNTRRVVKESALARYAQHPASLDHEKDLDFVWAEYALEDDAAMTRDAVEYARFLRSLCPYGREGDRLLIKEATYQGSDGLAYYLADRQPVLVGEEHALWAKADGEPYKVRALNTRFMPHAWARFKPEIIEEPFPQRVQDISEADAIAEGVATAETNFGTVYWGDGNPAHWSKDPREAFKDLWDSINAERGYGMEANPWVWVIKFERYEALEA